MSTLTTASIKSVHSTDTAHRLIYDHRHTCSPSGIRRTKFISNDYDVGMSIPPEEHSREMANHDIVHEGLPTGLQWDVEKDCFQFIKNRIKPATRRGILSVTWSLYDPLGFVAPVVMPAKQIMQDLCKERHLDWDDEVPNEIFMKCRTLVSELRRLEELSMIRCAKTSGSRTASNELHTVSDASSSGYGSVVYLRLTDTEGHHVSFHNGKSRVAPVKQTTTLRLERTADRTSIRLLAKMTHSTQRFSASVADHKPLALKKPSRSCRLTADDIEYPESNVIKWPYSTALLPEETRL